MTIAELRLKCRETLTAAQIARWSTETHGANAIAKAYLSYWTAKVCQAALADPDCADGWIEPKPEQPQAEPPAVAADRVSPLAPPDGNGQEGQAVLEALAEFVRGKDAQPAIDEARVREIARAVAIETIEEFVDAAGEALAAIQGAAT